MAWNQDCKFINEFAQSSAKNLAHVHSGVIVTIQMDTNHLDKLNEDLKLHGASIPVIENMKSKKESVEYFNQHKDYYFSEMHKILRSKKKTIPVDIIELFMSCKGLGLAKSAFLGQLATGHKSLVCIDSVNTRTYGFDAKMLSISKTVNPALKRKKIQAYIDMVENVAKQKNAKNASEFFWNEWCRLVADKSKERKNPNFCFKSGEDVSFKHRHWFTTWQDRWHLAH